MEATAHDTGRSAAGNIVAFPAAATPRPEPRYVLVTKSRGVRRRTLSRHSSIPEAGAALQALVREAPAGTQWCALYDRTKGAPSNPNAVALVLIHFSGERKAS